MDISRRKFIGNSAALIGGAFLNPLPVRQSAYAAGSDTLKLALIGSGARGAGAVRDAIRTGAPVELTAMADIFRDKLDQSYRALRGIEGVRDRVNVPEEHKFIGLDSYKHAIELADVVILATPPAFRPFHFEAAVEAGKHVFMEKPLACDAPGVRKILAAGKKADERGLKVVVGLQNRYGTGQNEFVKQIRGGAIGEILSMRCQYLIGDITLIPREENQSELEYQLRNWRHFCWLWGGSPAALTLHYTDIVNWVKEAHPIRAVGTGGRALYEGPDRGDIYDHFYIEYEYEDGTLLHSTTRHVPGGWFNRGCYFRGTKGIANHHAAKSEAEIIDPSGNRLWSFDYNGENVESPYVLEHKVLFDAIRNDTRQNDTQWGAHSTMTDIMGRMAAHSGHKVEWNEALHSEVVLVPERLTFDSEAPVQPDEGGRYRIPVPGKKDGVV